MYVTIFVRGVKTYYSYKHTSKQTRAIHLLSFSLQMYVTELIETRRYAQASV